MSAPTTAAAPATVPPPRLSTIRRAGKTAVMENGRAAERGPPAELIKAGALYPRLYGAWSESGAGAA